MRCWLEGDKNIMLKLDALFRYVERDTLMHKLDPRTKFIVILIYSIFIILSPSYTTQIIIILLSSILAISAKCFRNMMRSVLTVTPFFLIILFANYYFTRLDITAALTPSLRILSLVTVFTLFFLTTSPDDFSTALDKSGLPLTITLSFSLALKFIPTMMQQINEVMEAQVARGLKLDKGNILSRIRNYIPILIPVIILSIKRSIEVAEALEVRGLDLKAKRKPIVETSMSWRDYIYLALNTLIVVLLTAIVIYLAIP